ncbi:hypothetical protein LJC32_04980, partial [Oscillospiraceae bacterium OttesenSCG-928-F05]|nr:hypothetical protein [Oscillospiraceae bacterium OttesenSCG-928-F05]
MSSTSKTEHLSLNQWTSDDNPLRVDFNEDNAKIDAAVGNILASLNKTHSREFKSSGTWVCPADVTEIDALIVGGGDGGTGGGKLNASYQGMNSGGMGGYGGKGGSVRFLSGLKVLPGKSYAVVVGSGGTGGYGSSSANQSGSTGQTGGESTLLGYSSTAANHGGSSTQGGGSGGGNALPTAGTTDPLAIDPYTGNTFSGGGGGGGQGQGTYSYQSGA